MFFNTFSLNVTAALVALYSHKPTTVFVLLAAFLQSLGKARYCAFGLPVLHSVHGCHDESAKCNGTQTPTCLLLFASSNSILPVPEYNYLSVFSVQPCMQSPCGKQCWRMFTYDNCMHSHCGPPKKNICDDMCQLGLIKALSHRRNCSVKAASNSSTMDSFEEGSLSGTSFASFFSGN